MNDKALRARLLRGRAIKELGKPEEALACVDEVNAVAMRCGDFLVATLSLCDRAELANSQGHSREAMAAAWRAVALAGRTECGWVIANAQGTVGELLRDRGDLSASVEAYAAAVSSLEALEMWSLAAYMRVLLAEALLLVGRTTKAAAEVLSALPTIERENLSQEAVAAIGILREADTPPAGKP